jgi:tetratricopeptide (TPR) repeat protein
MFLRQLAFVLCLLFIAASPASALEMPSYSWGDTLDKGRVNRLLVQSVNLAQANPGHFDIRIQAAQLGYYAWRLEADSNTQRIQFGQLIYRLAKEAIALQPDHPGGHLWAGTGLAMMGLPRGILNSLQLVPEGRRHFEKSIELDPTYLNGIAYASIGHAYAVVPGFPISIGDKRKAQEYFVKAREMDPDSTLTLIFIGDLLWDLGRNQEAIKVLEEIGTKKPKTELDHFMFETNKRKARELIDLIRSGAKRDPLMDVISDIRPGFVN